LKRLRKYYYGKSVKQLDKLRWPAGGPAKIADPLRTLTAYARSHTASKLGLRQCPSRFHNRKELLQPSRRVGLSSASKGGRINDCNMLFQEEIRTALEHGPIADEIQYPSGGSKRYTTLDAGWQKLAERR